MATEIFHRGPIACHIDPKPLGRYRGGILNNKSTTVGHSVSVTGWGVDPVEGEYWIVRNSWGEYWGEFGFVRVAKGNNALMLESHCVWATLQSFTTEADLFSCYEDGSNCGAGGEVVHV
eukprot:gnl/TRDRNA2_/TRDRNA2_68115_c0_seq1.p1 gnl/TRDRNA2_/TRDRNA2_68115_c0~~gnl/TRDRNA2_/TRDRNA2_68115_c0_seq1.p1  ORF type:complete len:135 (-),score=4.80 gnl/TRDRNA2_/TRDRNA2_68115_c0_seq1:56-412(-)